MPGKRLSLRERELIQAGRRDGLSARQIGAELGRPHSTICREVARNKTCQNVYRAHVAQHYTRDRARRPKVFKLERHRWLAAHVERLLKKQWSPEQISVKFRREHPDDPRWWVSTESIYASLYVQGRGGLRAELTRYLRLKHKTRHGPDGRRTSVLPGAVNISQRPAEANDRAVPGHWEGDLIMGSKNQSQVGMLTERTTRYTLLFALPENRAAETVRDALAKTVRTLPSELRRSLAWDNGSEMAQHVTFTVATDLQVYFCDPASPWQRGTAEQTIWLLRAYLPKGTNLKRFTQRDLNSFAHELNQRPRKTLNWQSPAEAYAQLLAVQ
jgi:IS30 family transposase